MFKNSFKEYVKKNIKMREKKYKILFTIYPLFYEARSAC